MADQAIPQPKKNLAILEGWRSLIDRKWWNTFLKWTGFIEPGDEFDELIDKAIQEALEKNPSDARQVLCSLYLRRVQMLTQRIANRSRFNRYAMSIGFFFLCCSIYSLLDIYSKKGGRALKQALEWFHPLWISQQPAVNPTYFYVFVFLTANMLSRPFRRPVAELFGQLEKATAEYDLSLTENQNSDNEMRAEKLFRTQQYELRKFHRRGLTHATWVLIVGVASMVAGFLIVVYTINALGGSKIATTPDKVVTALLGGVGAILSNFVAAIFLKMFADIMLTQRRLYDGLLKVHEAHMANLFAEKLKGGSDLREKTLAELAGRLVEPESATPQTSPQTLGLPTPGGKLTG